jgi:Pentapeptide repeats (8 copies)
MAGAYAPGMDPTLTAAAIGVGGTVIVGLAGFWANVRNTSKTTDLTRRAIELTEQGQVADRYAKAVEQLGSDKLDVRIGAIYALERIAQDSVTDHPTVIEVLAAFIREHSREQWPPPAEAGPDGKWSRGRTRPDVQAAVTVIGRRNPRHDSQPVDLNVVDLTEANLIGANLSHASIGGANLADADLSGANLTGAVIFFTNCDGADFTGADLTGANLTSSNFTEAEFIGANLTGAILYSVNLTDADLTNADLTDATLSEDDSIPDDWVRDPDSGRLRRLSPVDDDS